MPPSIKERFPIQIDHFKSHFTNNLSSFSYIFPLENLPLYIEVYPLGGNPDYVSLFVKHGNANTEEIRVRIELSIVNFSGERCQTKLFRGRFSAQRPSTDQTFARYIHRNYLLDPGNLFLVNGTVYFSFEIEILNPTANNQTKAATLIPIKSSLVDCSLADIWQNGRCGDFVFIFPTAGEIKAHSEVLRKHSITFQQMFQENSGKTHHEVNDDVYYYGLMEVLRYLYYNVVDFENIESVVRIYETAVQLEILSLIDRCLEFFKTQISEDSAVSMLSLAQKLEADQFKQVVFNSFPPDFFKSIDFREKIKDDSTLLSQVYRHFNAKSCQ